MNFIRETDLIIFLTFILIPALIGIVAIKIYEDRWFKTQKDLLFFKIKYQLIVFAIILVLLYLKSPYSTSFDTFHYPEEISEIEDKKRLLQLLQKYNTTIHQTSEIIHWFIFLFATFFIGSIFNILKYLKLKD